jgi:hypothetical protein
MTHFCAVRTERDRFAAFVTLRGPRDVTRATRRESVKAVVQSCGKSTERKSTISHCSSVMRTTKAISFFDVPAPKFRSISITTGQECFS